MLVASCSNETVCARGSMVPGRGIQKASGPPVHGASGVGGDAGADEPIELVIGIVPVAVDAIVGGEDVAVGREA